MFGAVLPADTPPPLARTCGVVVLACLGLGAARPAPLVLGIVFVLLLGVPWFVAVAYRSSHETAPPTT